MRVLRLHFHGRLRHRPKKDHLDDGGCTLKGQGKMSIRIKSAYRPSELKDGTRYLVETLWPSHVKNVRLLPYSWLQELAPSYGMKEKAHWEGWSSEKYRENYWDELQEPKRRVLFDQVVEESGKQTVTLLHRSYKEIPKIRAEDSSVYYLRDFIEEALHKRYRLQSQSKAGALET